MGLTLPLCSYLNHHCCNFIVDYKLVCAFPSELMDISLRYIPLEKDHGGLPEKFAFLIELLPESSVHMNDTVYWLSSLRITKFDVNSERSQLLSCAHGAIGIINGKLCAAHLRDQKLYLSTLSNTYSNTMQMQSNAKAWVQMQPEIDLDISLPADSSSDYASYGFSGRYNHGRGGVVSISSDVVLLQNGNIFYSYDIKKKASYHFGEVDVDTNARIAAYVNHLVEL
ncbi:hypothetical protein DITRI_Ditri18aG0104700 [Diplodiscus trichospermus]